jgi:hypothetical protein
VAIFLIKIFCFIMLKLLVFFLGFIFCSGAFAQNPVVINSPYDFQKWIRVKDSIRTTRSINDSTLQFPSGCGVPIGTASLKGGDKRKPAIFYDTCGHNLYIWKPEDTSWSAKIGSSEQIVGSIYQKATFTSLSGFIINGATVSATGGHLAFSGGNPYNQTLDVAYNHCLESWRIAARLQITATGSGGPGVGVRSCASVYGYHVFWGLNTATNIPELRVGNLSVVTPGGPFLYSSGDSLELVIELDKTILTGSIRNITTKSGIITVTYNYNSMASPYLPNTGRFCIYNTGSSFNVDSLSVWSKVLVNPSIILFGDSKHRIYSASSEGRRVSELLNNMGRSVDVLAGASDRLADMIARSSEVIALAGPNTKVVMGGCSNNIRDGQDSTTYTHLYDSLVTIFTNARLDVYHITGLYEPSINQNPFRNYVYKKYPLSKIIETLIPTNIPGLVHTDNVHLNDAGQRAEFNAIVTSGKLGGLNTTYDPGSTVIKNQKDYYQSAYFKILGTATLASLASGNTPPTTTGTLRKVVSDSNGLISHRQLDFVSLADYGVKANDTAVDYTTTIQSVLNTGARTVLVPAGSYIITATLRIKSYQTLLAYGARFKRAANITAVIINDADGVTGGYNANSNISILGLAIDGNAFNYSGACTLIAFGHASNITIRDCEFYSATTLSLVEINGCRNTLVQNSYFHDAVTLTNTECIRTNLMLSSGAFQWFGPYDSTSVDGLTIKDCNFRFSTTAIGQHSLYDYAHTIKNITVENCNIYGMTDKAIRSYNFQNFTVRNCTIDSCTHGIYDYDINFFNPYGLQRNITIQGNRITRTILNSSEGRPLQVWGWRNINISENVIDSCRRHALGIGYNSDTFFISHNIIRKFAQGLTTDGFGIVIWGATNGIIDGNFVSCEAAPYNRDAIFTHVATFTPRNISITNNVVNLPFFLSPNPITTPSAFNQRYGLEGTNIYVGHNIVNDTSICNTKYITANYTLSGTEGIISANTTAGNITVTLQPRLLNDGITIIRSAGTNSLTLTPNSGLIGGLSSITVDSFVTIKSDGTNYFILAVGAKKNSLLRPLDVVTTDANNSGTGETDLYSYAIQPGTLFADGQYIDVDTYGTLNDNTATAQLKVYYAGNLLINTTALSISTAPSTWRIKGKITRSSSTTARAVVEINAPGLSQTYFINNIDLTSLDFTAANILKVTAQAGGGGSNDITGKAWHVIFYPQP